MADNAALHEYLDPQVLEGVRCLRDHVDTVFKEQEKATQMASSEREKAAQVLAVQLGRAIEEGDNNLREHIANQVRQIEAALVSAERLEIERIEKVALNVESMRREVSLVHAASERALQKAQESANGAIAKQEESVAARLKLLNEFKAQYLSDQSRFATRESVDARIEALTKRVDENRAVLLPRENFEAAVAEWTIWRGQVNRRLDTREGLDAAKDKQASTMQPWLIWVAGAFVTIIVTAVIIVANILTAGP